MKTIANLAGGLLVGVLLAAGLPLPAARAQDAAHDRDVITIELKPQVEVDDTIIYLGQIATLSGGPISLRQRLSGLDAAEFRLHTNQTYVSRAQVMFRLMLANVHQTRFRLMGAERTRVTESGDAVAARKILAAAARSVETQYPGISLSADVVAPAIDLRRGEAVCYEATRPVRVSREGVIRVNVAVKVNDTTREIVPVSFQSSTGKAAPVTPGVIITRPPAAATAPKEKAETLIRTRDRVKIVAAIGAARIEALGEAQQDGRLGDVIRVRNIESNRVVNARVESAGVVVVE